MDNTLTEEEFTVDEIVNSFNSLDDATNWYNLQFTKLGYIPRPKKPAEPKNGSPDDYLRYADELGEYAKELASYNNFSVKRSEVRAYCDEVIQRFLWKNTGLNTVVPEQYRAKVWNMAYDLGHAYGYSEIQNYLLDLVDIFEQ